MAQFINTSRGYINLDHILWIRIGVAREAGEVFLQAADGRVFQCQLLDPFPPPAAMLAAPAPMPAADETERPKYADEPETEVCR